MDKTKILNLLSICRKSGRMDMGFDAAKSAASDGRACAVILAADTSEKTKKEVRFFAEKYSVPVYAADFTMEEFYFAAGKKAGVISINDRGFADRVSELTTE